MDIDELVGKEDRVLVVEDSLEFVGAGGGVDLVVGGEEIAAGKQLRVAAIVGVDRDALVRCETLSTCGNWFSGSVK